MWPHDFELQLTVKLGGSGSAASATSGVLKTTLAVLNTGDAPFSFTAALHTYFGVSDIAKTRVLGLKGVPYHDGNVPDESALAGRKRFDGDDADTINFDGEFDRIYCGAPDWLTIEDEAGGRAIGVEKHGLPDAVMESARRQERAHGRLRRRRVEAHGVRRARGRRERRGAETRRRVDGPAGDQGDAHRRQALGLSVTRQGGWRGARRGTEMSAHSARACARAPFVPLRIQPCYNNDRPRPHQSCSKRHSKPHTVHVFTMRSSLAGSCALTASLSVGVLVRDGLLSSLHHRCGRRLACGARLLAPAPLGVARACAASATSRFACALAALPC